MNRFTLCSLLLLLVVVGCGEPECPNGVIEEGEGCDDGNTTNGDGCDANCTLTGCGNNIITQGEDCEDGNLANDDGCSNSCEEEQGFDCIDTIGANPPSACTALCGDNLILGEEECDDGNQDDNDACPSTCQNARCGDGFTQSGVEECDDGNAINGDGCDINCTLSACGNGVIDPQEECDDGNQAPDDGCDPNCVASGCGNSFVSPSEACDDGNKISGDGCRGDCQKVEECGDDVIDEGEECDGSSPPCDATCQRIPVCRDGFLDAPEVCDDGNNVSGDGCDTNCTLTACGNGATDPTEGCDDGNVVSNDRCSSTCAVERCGDGILQAPEPVTQIDFIWLGRFPSICCSNPPPEILFSINGTVIFSGQLPVTNSCFPGIQTATIIDPAVLALLINGNNLFTIETNGLMAWAVAVIQQGSLSQEIILLDTDGFVGGATERNPDICSGGSGSLQPPLTVSVPLFVTEQCDDGDNDTTDACPTTCQPARCGDGFTLAGIEECDDGNNQNGDGCRPDCSVELCGDSILDPQEVCDDGNTNANDGCRADCAGLELCGDGLIDTALGEACDDKNLLLVGCDSLCQIEAGFICTGEPSACNTVCGDGIVAGIEECDDGNLQDGDGCEADCTLPVCQNGIVDPGEICLEQGGRGVRNQPLSVTVFDFNQDGHLDLAVSDPDHCCSTVGGDILLGNGTGFFPQSAIGIDAGQFSRGFVAGDFNEDGTPDLIGVDENSGVVLLPGGSFAGTFPTGGVRPFFIASSDFNQDTHQDIVVANFNSNNVSVFLGNGDLTFQNGQVFPAVTNPSSIATGDFNQDGVVDLVVSSDGSNNIGVLLGNSNGSFGAQQASSVGFVTHSVRVADFNGDAHLDIAAAGTTGSVGILPGNGDGTFQAVSLVAAGCIALSIAVGDLNLDGAIDLAVVNGDSQTPRLNILQGNGDGAFQSPLSLGGQASIFVEAGDFNGDGVPDLVVAHLGGQLVGVFHSTP